jgi:hypothetical protein
VAVLGLAAVLWTAVPMECLLMGRDRIRIGGLMVCLIGDRLDESLKADLLRIILWMIFLSKGNRVFPAYVIQEKAF